MTKATVKGIAAQNRAGRSLWERFSAPIIVICIIIVSVLGLFGYYQRHELTLAKDNIDRLRGELESLKRGREAPSQTETEVKITIGREFRLRNGQRGVMGPDFRITVTAVESKSDSSQPVVSANVELKGSADMQIRKAKPGYRVTYPEEGGYVIEVLDVDSDSARFLLTKDR